MAIKTRTLSDPKEGKFYPLTHTKAVVDDGGNSVDSLLAEKQDALDALNANTGISEYPAFDSAKAYAVGDVVKYEGRLYRFTAEHAQGEWIGTDVVSWSEKQEIEGKVAELESEIGSSLFSKKYSNNDLSGLIWGGTADGWLDSASYTIDSVIVPLLPKQTISWTRSRYIVRVFDYKPTIGEKKDNIYVSTSGDNNYTNETENVVYLYFDYDKTSEVDLSATLSASGIYKELSDLSVKLDGEVLKMNKLSENLNGISGYVYKEIGFEGSVKVYTNKDLSGIFWAGVADGWLDATAKYDSLIIPLMPSQTIDFTGNSLYLARVFNYEPKIGLKGDFIETISDGIQTYTNNQGSIVYVYFQRDPSEVFAYSISLDGGGLKNELSKLTKDKVTVVAFGDSITAVAERNVPYKRYSDYYAEEFNCNPINLAIGGTRITARHEPVSNPTNVVEAYGALDMVNFITAWVNGDLSLAEIGAEFAANYEGDPNPDARDAVERAKNISIHDVDVITICGGANDYTGGGLSGTIDDDEYVNTICGAYKRIVKAILTANPYVRIYILTPIVRYFGSVSEENWCDNYKRGDRYYYNLVDTIKDVAEKMKIPCLDLYRTLGWNQYNYMDMMRNDGINDITHPYRGLAMLGRKIGRWISSN